MTTDISYKITFHTYWWSYIWRFYYNQICAGLQYSAILFFCKHQNTHFEAAKYLFRLVLSGRVFEAKKCEKSCGCRAFCWNKHSNVYVCCCRFMQMEEGNNPPPTTTAASKKGRHCQEQVDTELSLAEFRRPRNSLLSVVAEFFRWVPQGAGQNILLGCGTWWLISASHSQGHNVSVVVGYVLWQWKC